MKLKKDNQIIKVKPHGTEFIFTARHRFINNSPKTLRALGKLYNRGWEDIEEVTLKEKLSNAISWVKLLFSNKDQIIVEHPQDAKMVIKTGGLK